MKNFKKQIFKITALTVITLFMGSSVFAQVQETQKDTTAQDTTMQTDQQQTLPQEQNQRINQGTDALENDKGVDYTETADKSELPQEVNTSLDELYPAHEVTEVFKGDDDSYKVKVKNENDEAFVYYNAEGDFLRAHNLTGLQQEGALPQNQSQRTQESQDQNQWGTDDDRTNQQESQGAQQQEDQEGTWGTDDEETQQETQGTQQENLGTDDRTNKQENKQNSWESDDKGSKQKMSNNPDKDVDYSEEIEKSELPQAVSSSLDELYPAHEINNVYRGEDDSFKVKVKNEDDEAVVYYSSEGEFLRAKSLGNMQQGAFSQEQSQRTEGSNDFSTWDADNDGKISETEFSDGLFSQGKNDAGLFDGDDKDSKGLSEIGSQGKNDSGVFDSDDKDSKGLSEIGSQGKNDSGVFDSDDKDSKGLSEIGSEIGYDDDTFYETSYTWWDANDDQRLDESEWNLGYNNSFGDYLDDDFDAFDTDKDGYLSYDEYYDSVYETEFYSDWDINDDDMLDNNEYSAGVFDTWDVNDDNYIDENEYNDLDLVIVDLRTQQNQKGGSAYPQEQSQKTGDDMHSKMNNKAGKMHDKGEDKETSSQEMNQRIENVEESQDADRWGTEQRMPEQEKQEDNMNSETDEAETNWGPEDQGAHQSTWEEDSVENIDAQESNQQGQWGTKNDTVQNEGTANPQEQNQRTNTTWDTEGNRSTESDFGADTENYTAPVDTLAAPQEQFQRGIGTNDNDVDYSEEVQENELPESITTSLDDLYPDHEIEEAYRGDDDSYKVKIKKDDENVAVFYDSEGQFNKEENMKDMLKDKHKNMHNDMHDDMQKDKNKDKNKDTNQDW